MKQIFDWEFDENGDNVAKERGMPHKQYFDFLQEARIFITPETKRFVYNGKEYELIKYNISGLQQCRSTANGKVIPLNPSTIISPEAWKQLQAMDIPALDKKLMDLATGFLESWHNSYIHDISLSYWAEEREAARERYKELSAMFEPDGMKIEEPAARVRRIATSAKKETKKSFAQLSLF